MVVVADTTTGTTTISTGATAEHRKASPPINLERNDADRVIPLAVALTAHLETPSAPAIPPLTPNMAGAISCGNGSVRAGWAYRAGRHDTESRRMSSQGQRSRSHGRSRARSEPREIYTEVAKQWRTLADQVEKRGS